MQTGQTHADFQDLNFLYLIDALYRERSVSRTAERLNLTQSAVSHSLNRLRERLNDPLFVRVGMHMAPTPEAERIAQAARRALSLIQTEIWHTQPFDPLTSTRSFTVGMTDMGGTVALPRVMKALSACAPQVRINPVAVQSGQVSALLENGTLDAAWGYFGKLSSTLYQQALYRRQLIGIRRKSGRKKGHKTRRKGNGPEHGVDFDAFVQAQHVLTSATQQTNELLRQQLRAHGHRLNVVMTCPWVLAVPAIVAGSDYIATVPQELAQLFMRLEAIDTFALPLNVPDLVVKQYWHARNHEDAGHKWFRALVFEVLSAAQDVA